MFTPGTPSPEQLRILLTRAEREGMDACVIERLNVILHFAEHQYSISETCRQFGISRSTFHRWMERFDPENLSTLADKSHEPLSVRQSAIEPMTVELIRRYRTRYPQMGKERIAELLTRDHATPISASSVGRIIDRECLYFADTPLHWKKRMEQQRTQGAISSVDQVQASPADVLVTTEEIASSAQHVEILQDDGDVERGFTPRFTWQGIKRFIVVSSVITNIAFVSLLIGMGLFERSVTEESSPDRNPNIEIESHETLHAAPTQVFIP